MLQNVDSTSKKHCRMSVEYVLQTLQFNIDSTQIQHLFNSQPM